ncbi:uncharacterized protein LOC108628599 [Ceratina calcarata]|uniref:Uncharacterized protein LOC108628599 n=1 Tax=Ceratina calcarata TaxID=156304 RepID=A0AAJ7NAT9_9HYME|nr:uncharacterized protein LOC108628599 [Ceratina calcarata]
MENRPASLRSKRVCRFCLTESEPLHFIYERDHSKPLQIPLTLKIISCVAIEVYAADGMPQMICNMCRWNLDRSYRFKLQCKKADEALRAYPLSGILPRPFPPIPCDPPDINNKRPLEQRSPNEGAKKPRVDNDRDRRETRERERERDREKERDRQAEEQRDYYEEEQDAGSENDQEATSGKEDRKLEPGEIRVHACDQCERTFPLRQALALHISRAHRDRSFKCTECERMFFSKYDLQKHAITHAEEKPYSCPICKKQFSRANLLQRHEKVHREELNYACQHCDREFFTAEDLEKHDETMHKKEKPYQCNICNKCFTYKQGLERHEMLHSEDKTFVCEYCKEAFRTSTKLARHLTSHAGHRPYLCKLCPRSFLLSHHLTRHMRTHSVEKRHVCEDCGKAFKRKESLEVHQLTHTKRTGMGLTCDVCQESCRNRADYVTHIKQHIEAGEKMGPDGLPPDNKSKLDIDSDEEEEEEQYSDGDDDYTPPAYIVRKLPKPVKPSESEEEQEVLEKEEQDSQKEQVVYVRRKDGNMVKKTIKTLMPIPRKDVQDAKLKQTSISNQSQSNIKSSQSKQNDETPKSSRVDETEAQVQKIVASVFKEHKIPLKHQNVQEQNKESHAPTNQTKLQQSTQNQVQKEEKPESTVVTSTPKTVNTVKVIKRIVVRKPGGTTDTTATTVPAKEDGDAGTSTTQTNTGHKVTKRVIVRRIIRQGDTTREVIMNPDGTIIDPAELAKLPTGNVVKRVVVKKPIDKHQSLVQAVLQSATTDVKQPSGATIKSSDTVLNETPKFELKTSQSTPSASSLGTKTTVTTTQKPASTAVGDRETKEKLEQLEKRVEQQRLKIEELEARKQQQQEYEPTIEEMSPERHDESDDEQQLPLKRVFVKKKQSMYDEEQEYNDTETTVASLSTPASTPISTTTTLATTGIESVQILLESKKEKEASETEIKTEIKTEVETESENIESCMASTTITTVPASITIAPTTIATTTIATTTIGTTTTVPVITSVVATPAVAATTGVIATVTAPTIIRREGKPIVTSSKVYSNKKIIVVKAEEASEVEEMNRELCNILDSADSVVKMQESVLSNLTQISIVETPQKTCSDKPKAGPSNVEDFPTKVETDETGSADEEISLKLDNTLDIVNDQESDRKVEPVPAEVQELMDQSEESTSLNLEQELSESGDIFEPSDNVLGVQKNQLSDSVIVELDHANHTITLNDTNDSQDSLEDKLQQMEG